MCDCEPTRRDLLIAATTLAAIAVAGGSTNLAHALETEDHRPAIAAPPVPAVLAQHIATIQVAPLLAIQPRAAWGADLPPKGAMGSEDVKFLLIHHTASSNVVADPREVIRQTYAFQTGPSKRWADVCYHFFIGPDGSVWEGRAGSLDGPVVADATGGNQGYAQLICLIGNFMAAAPTPAAQESLMRLMIFLADRYAIDTDPNATVTFTSRGSNKYRAGSSITTSTISGHRDTSATACPGDTAYPLLARWRARVHATIVHREQPGPYATATRRSVHLD